MDSAESAAEPANPPQRQGRWRRGNERRAVSAMFPRYVTAEAKRIGCGNIEVNMPG